MRRREALETEETAIDAPPGLMAILCKEITSWLVDAAADLTYLARSPDPDLEIAEVAALGRMATAVRCRRVRRPDATALAVIGELADGIDEANRYEEVAAAHEAFRILRALLAGTGRDDA